MSPVPRRSVNLGTVRSRVRCSKMVTDLLSLIPSLTLSCMLSCTGFAINVENPLTRSEERLAV